MPKHDKKVIKIILQHEVHVNSLNRIYFDLKDVLDALSSCPEDMTYEYLDELISRTELFHENVNKTSETLRTLKNRFNL